MGCNDLRRGRRTCRYRGGAISILPTNGFFTWLRSPWIVFIFIAWCPATHRTLSRRFPAIEIEQPTEPRPAPDRSALAVVVARHHHPRRNKVPTEPLVKALDIVVRHKLPDKIPEMSLSKDHEVIEALDRMVLTNLSACGLQFGLCAGIRTLSTPPDSNSSVQPSVYSGSRSWMSCCQQTRAGARGARRLSRTSCDVGRRDGA
jgi:hypothetical protein